MNLDEIYAAAEAEGDLEVMHLVHIARAAQAYVAARRIPVGTPLERSLLADRILVAVDKAGLGK